MPYSKDKGVKPYKNSSKKKVKDKKKPLTKKKKM